MSNWLRYPGSVSKRGNDHIRLLPIASNSLAQCAQHDHTYRSLTKSDSSLSYFSTVMTIDNFSPTIALIFAGCISTWPKASGVTTIPARANDPDILQAATVSGPLTMWGQPIEFAFQQKDLSRYTTNTSAPTSSASAPPTSSPVMLAVATATSLLSVTSPTSAPGNYNNKNNNSSFSTGTKAGIEIGVAVIAILMLVCAFFLL